MENLKIVLEHEYLFRVNLKSFEAFQYIFNFKLK